MTARLFSANNPEYLWFGIGVYVNAPKSCAISKPVLKETIVFYGPLTASQALQEMIFIFESFMTTP